MRDDEVDWTTATQLLDEPDGGFTAPRPSSATSTRSGRSPFATIRTDRRHERPVPAGPWTELPARTSLRVDRAAKLHVRANPRPADARGPPLRTRGEYPRPLRTHLMENADSKRRLRSSASSRSRSLTRSFSRLEGLGVEPGRGVSRPRARGRSKIPQPSAAPPARPRRRRLSATRSRSRFRRRSPWSNEQHTQVRHFLR